MQQQPGGGQFGGSNQSNYYMPTPSPYQQQQGTPMSFVHSPGSAIEPSPGGNVYSSIHQQPMSAQAHYQYMSPSPAQQSELSRQLGFGSAPSSVGSPMPTGTGSGYRSQPPSLQPHMLPPTPQPPTPRGGPQTPASVGPIGSVGGGDYSVASVGGPGSVNPATPRSVGEQPLSVSDQQQQQLMAAKVPMVANSSFASLLDQDSNSQIGSPQAQQQSQTSGSSIQQQQQPQVMGRQNLADISGTSGGTGGRGANVSGNLAGSATLALQNLEQFGPLALCSMGKELTHELVNRTADMFGMLKTLTDPGQQFPKTASPEIVQQLYEKEKRLSDSLRHTAGLVHRLTAICVRLEQLSKERLPPDARDRMKELLPYMDDSAKPFMENGNQMEEDKKPSYLQQIRVQAEQREEFQTTRAEHEKTKLELLKRRDHLKQIMEFLRDFCWQISMVSESNASSA